MKILFVSTHLGPHKSHQGFIDAMRADVFVPKYEPVHGSPFPEALAMLSNVGRLPKDYDLYVTETNFYIPALARRAGKLKKNAKIMNIYAGRFLHSWLKGFHSVTEPGKELIKGLHDEVDGHIVLGKMGMEQISKISKKPAVSVYPHITPEFAESLKKIRWMPEKLSMLTVARFDWRYKGLDLVIDAFLDFQRNNPGAKLTIVHNAELPPELKSRINRGIKLVGYVPDIARAYSTADLYLQVGRGDAFPVAALEAMAVGVPTITSGTVGVKEIVSRVDGRLVVNENADSLLEAMKYYHSLGAKRKSGISRSFKLEGERFFERKTVPLFRKRFGILKRDVCGAADK